MNTKYAVKHIQLLTLFTKEKAVGLFHKAAKQNPADAQYNLALCYVKSEGVPQDLEEGVKWLRKAARNGNKEADRILRVSAY